MNMYLYLSDTVLVIHFLFVIFVVAGFLFIAAGAFLHLHSAENFTFRIVHLLAVFYFTIQSWFGKICPLTVLESELRSASGGSSYKSGFIKYWLEKIIYYDFPLSYFVAVYTAFLSSVVLFWIFFPPVKAKKRGK